MAETETPEIPEDDAMARLTTAFLEMAARVAMTPVVVNRFQLLQTGQLPDHQVLVVGGGGFAELREVGNDSFVSKNPLSNIAGCFAFNKEMAADLVLFLQRDYAIDAEYLAQRKLRYPNQFPADRTDG